MWTLLLRATTKAEAAKCQKYHDLQSNYHLQPVAIETTGVYGKSTAPFLSGLTKKLVDASGDPGSASGSTSVCPWLWSGEMLPAFWPVCEFDLTLRVLFLVAAFNILITITAYHLPLYQCVPCALVKYLVNRMAYDESTAWFRVQHGLKPLRPL